MDALSLLADLERYTSESATLHPHDQTVISTKLLQLRLEIEAMIKKSADDQAGLLSKLEKKRREHKVSQQLLTLNGRSQ